MILKLNFIHFLFNARIVHRFASPQIEVRALIEGQMLHRKAIASDMGFNFGENTRILATGGGSANKSILQVMADVFNAPVYIQVSFIG
jgi:xylulokinase